MQVSFDPLDMADLDPINELVASVSWPHRREDIAQFIRLGGGRVVREQESGRVLGTGLYWVFGDALARIGLVIVSPECQGQGIGRRLMARLLDDSAERPIVLLATEAGKPLYESLGFTTFDRSQQFQGLYQGGVAERDLRISTVSQVDIERIAEMDLSAFGAPRASILRDLAQTGETAVLTEGGEIAGYAMARPFGRGTVIGPIVAETEGNAVALFHALARPGFVRVDCPASAGVLIEALIASGLRDAGVSAVMARGAWHPPSSAATVFGLASHALG